MLFWRKRNEGFEWREYVRTTILLRRKDRRDRIVEARDAALFGVKHAGRKSWVAGAESAGAVAASLGGAARWLRAHLVDLAAWLLARLGAGASAVLVWLAPLPSRVSAYLSSALGPRLAGPARALRARLEPALETLLQPGVRLGLAVAGAVAALAAAIRSALVGLDGEAQFAAAIAIAAGALTLGPALLAGRTVRLFQRVREALVSVARHAGGVPPFDRIVVSRAGAIAAVVLVAVVAAATGYGIWHEAVSQLQDQGVETAALSTPREVQGTAFALTGDSLRVSNVHLRLDGIEAPESEQLCSRAAGRTWRCGQAAREALSRLVRGKRVICTVSKPAGQGPALARCSAGGADIAEQMVREGHVFALSEMFSVYGGSERQAEAAKAGIWSGTAERPADFRTKRWEAAKRNAPEGCPIKGRVVDRSRVYLLPWSPAYDRVKVSTARGERWFCSEAEARAAGWRPVERS